MSKVLLFVLYACSLQPHHLATLHFTPLHTTPFLPNTTPQNSGPSNRLYKELVSIKIHQDLKKNMSKQQPPHYTLIIRLPFPRPQGQHFDTTSTTVPQPQPHNPAHQQQTTQTLENTEQRSSNPTSASRSPASAPAAQPPVGSEGTPSMGSSFSDLSGASVAQSALEEALMSDLRADGGGLGSRVSTVGR